MLGQLHRVRVILDGFIRLCLWIEVLPLKVRVLSAHGDTLLKIFCLSNSFYAFHALYETHLTFKHRQVVLTDATGFVTLLTGILAVATVKVIVDWLTAHMAEELVFVPLHILATRIVFPFRPTLGTLVVVVTV